MHADERRAEALGERHRGVEKTRRKRGGGQMDRNGLDGIGHGLTPQAGPLRRITSAFPGPARRS
jgi:hypothetical protein